MEILNKVDVILNIILILSLIVSFFVMKKVRAQASTEKNQDVLDRNEKIIIWITCLLAPLFAGLIYYFGWKRILPQKAKQANNISWLAMLILAFVWLTASALF